MTPGSTVMVDRDESGDEEDKPLSLEIIPPSKPPAVEPTEPEPEKVGVGAKGGTEPDGDSGSEGESPAAHGDAANN
jgi:hypothetical protein